MSLKNHNTNGGLQALQQLISVGDENAFASLYDIFSKRLEVFSCSLVHSNEIAEDVVEEVFIKLWTKRHTIAEIDNLAVYLYVAVKNQSLNKLSEKARKLVTAPFDGIMPQVEALHSDPYTILATSEMLVKMNKAIEDLPPRCKMIFKLVREDGLRYKEVSEILNISVNTIDVQMAIAVRRLCQALGLPQKRPKNLFKAVPDKKEEKS